MGEMWYFIETRNALPACFDLPMRRVALPGIFGVGLLLNGLFHIAKLRRF
jgi:hypothetical protein